MNITHLIAHDPDTGDVQVYGVTLTAVIKPTGRVDEHGRREVDVDWVERAFVDRSVGSALAEVLGLDRAADSEGSQP